ncbi:MAG: type II toxin-antitoxin system VapC family toxin [Chloroflexi bacterium]|nr:type II toxin-antitoxin system VapC family toxin [Chloroflexota bacterium]
MITYYFDASAIAKRYLREPGNRWVMGLMSAPTANHVTSIELVTVELVSALTKAHRERRISSSYRERLIGRALADSRTDIGLLAVSQTILDLATELATRHPLRAYDAIHLAAVLDWTHDLTEVDLPAPIFVSADENLLAAARAEGLVAENPNEHE